MELKEIAEKYVYGFSTALTDNQEVKDLMEDIKNYADEQVKLNLPVVSREFKEKQTPPFEEFVTNICKNTDLLLINPFTKELSSLSELIHKWKITNDIKP